MIKVFFIIALFYITSCAEKHMYNNDLSDPESVLDGYIRSLVYGDVDQTLYYISGNREKIGNYKVLSIWMKGKARERAKRRFTEHISWNIEQNKCDSEICVFGVVVSIPDDGYIIKRRRRIIEEKGVSPDKAESIIRKEGNLPLESKEFKAYMKKNEYGWIFDSMDERNDKLGRFIHLH